MNTIENYLSVNSRDHALLISGHWGVGKTYTWMKFCEALEGKTIINVSAAGLQSREDIERALFQASIASAKNGVEALVKEAGTVIGRAALRWVKVDPSDITLRADLIPGKTIICIDDVERFQGDFAVLFGLVISLLDADHIHVILIADDTKATELKNYSRYRERIVGTAVRVCPDVPAFVDKEIKKYPTEPTRKLLLNYANTIVDGLAEWGIENLRTVRSILEEIELIFRAAGVHEGLRLNLRPLLSAVCYWKQSIANDASTAPLVEQSFRTETLAFIIGASSRREQAKDGEENQVTANIRKLGFEDDAIYWSKSPELAKLVGGLDADRALIAKDFELNPTDEPSAPYQILNRYWAHTPEELEAAAARLIEKLTSFQCYRTDELYAAHAALHRAAIERIIHLSEDEVIDLTIASIAGHSPERMQAVDIDDLTQLDATFSHEVVAALRELSSRIEVAEQKTEISKIVEKLLAQGELSPDDMHKPILSTIDPEDFFGRLLELNASSVHQVSVALGAKIRGGLQTEEVSFAESAAHLIERSIPAEGKLTAAQAQLLYIARRLERAATAAKATSA